MIFWFLDLTGLLLWWIPYYEMTFIQQFAVGFSKGSHLHLIDLPFHRVVKLRTPLNNSQITNVHVGSDKTRLSLRSISANTFSAAYSCILLSDNVETIESAAVHNYIVVNVSSKQQSFWSNRRYSVLSYRSHERHQI